MRRLAVEAPPPLCVGSLTGGPVPGTGGAAPSDSVKNLCKHPPEMDIRARSTRLSGFTLLELMIALVVLGILASIALPSFLDQMRKGRRSDAFELVTRVLQAQERYRTTHSSFAATVDALTPFGVTATSSGGHYGLSIDEASGIGYTISITPVTGGKQAADAQCAEFKVVQLRGGMTRTATNSAGGNTSTTCWPQ